MGFNPEYKKPVIQLNIKLRKHMENDMIENTSVNPNNSLSSNMPARGDSSPIGNSCGAIEGAIARLEIAIQMLHDKLEPALSPVPPAPSAPLPSEDPAPQSTLNRLLHGIEIDIDRLSRYVREITERCQL